MRVLFASLASVGHTYPMIPLAVAAGAAGHEVRWAAGEAVHEPLAANGLAPFRPADSFYEMYAEDLAPELARWRPDLVVSGWGVPGAAVAAREAGIPGLWHGFGRLFPAGIGLTPPIEVADQPHLDICPPSLQDKDFVDTAARIALRPVPYAEPSGWDGPDARWPLVYLTLGTAFGTAELLATAVAGLSTLDVEVVVATGRVRPAEVGAVPDHVTVRDWVPQAELVRRAAVVVHHGGSGTMLGALVAGVPQVVVPRGADQFANADALVTAGAAVRLDAPTATGVADAVRAVLADHHHRAAARAVAEEIAAMPAPAEVAGRLDQLSR